MAKRFTDSEKWKDPFFENLTKELKLAWLYILDDCDHAGIWQKSIKRLNFAVESNLSEEDLLKAFRDRVTILNDDKWFIVKFVTFQYGNDFINSKQKAVISAVKILNENRLIKELDNGSLTLSIPYDKGLNTLMDKDKDMDKVKDKFMDKDLEIDTDKFQYKVMDLNAEMYKRRWQYSSEHDPNAFDELIKK